MVRILQIVSHLKQNGTETFIINLFRNIDRSKYMFDFLVFSDAKDGFYDEIISLGGRIYQIEERRKNFYAYHSNLNDFFKKHGYQYGVVHMHMGSLSSLAPLYYAKKYDIPVRIFHSHSSSCDGIHNIIFHNLNKLRLKKVATHYFACSEKAKTWAFKGTSALIESKIITNGIDLSRFIYNPTKRNQIREKLNLKDNFVIGHVGTFNEIKNHSFLIDIFVEVISRHPNSILMLIGEGPLMGRIQRKAANLHLENKILFLGKRNDVNDLMQAIDALVMPSLFEGLPFTLIEAQAANIPIIASSGIPIESKLSDNYHVISLSEPATKWTQIILRYVNYQKTPINSNDKICRYSIDQTTKQILSVYS